MLRPSSSIEPGAAYFQLQLIFMKLLLRYGVIAMAGACPMLSFGQSTDSAHARQLDELIVTASRTAQKRREAPVAISTISTRTITDTKANQLDQLLNKVSGVFMVDLGNEQHEMSIRQPMSTSGVFLYLEDGIPIRTTGVFNHNALLEMNSAATKQIEVIRGPASSLYGAEAIGGAVNVLTVTPPVAPAGMVSLQRNNNGYTRAEAQLGSTFGKWGFIASGYYANRSGGPIQYSDFHKTAATLRMDGKLSEKLTWTNSLSYVNYYSDMYGSLDSVHFAQRNYNTPYSFTYRKVEALRVRSTLDLAWKEGAGTHVTVVYRNNSVGQNPSYYISDSRTNPLLANGQINDNSFHSVMGLVQHRQDFTFLQSRLIAGVSVDISPSNYWAKYIAIRKDAKGNYGSYTPTDSLLSRYSTGISNIAQYINYEVTLFQGLKVAAAVRYDHFHYAFNNSLPASASTGSPDTRNDFDRVTPKVGATYNYKGVGFYANYSQGYVPPQVTDLYNGVKVPYLKPQTFFNYEVGGWLAVLKNIVYADWSVYRMDGTNQIINVRQSDGTFVEQNAGKTRHVGVEYGVTVRPSEEWTLRVSGANSDHWFIVQQENGHDYSGRQMAAAPHFIANAELTWRPAFLKGFRIGAEWQQVGRYWMDDANTVRNSGFGIVNVRTGYVYRAFEIWVNALNAFNKYYAALATRSTYGYSYNLGDPREITLGLAWHFLK